MTTGSGLAETAAERYLREAKARLAGRIGEDLAEGFFHAAASASRDVVTVAELMAAAYKAGAESLGLPHQEHTWYRSWKGGRLWRESGDPAEVLDAGGDRFEKLERYTVSPGWEPWTPGKENGGEPG